MPNVLLLKVSMVSNTLLLLKVSMAGGLVCCNTINERKPQQPPLILSQPLQPFIALGNG